MAYPSRSDLRFFNAIELSDKQWDFNFNQVISFLTTNFDANFGNVIADTVVADLSGSTGFPSSDLTFIAGQAITAGKYCRLVDNQLFYANNFSSETSSNLIGFSKTSGASGEQVTVQYYGIFSGLTGLTPNAIYYLSDTLGGITTTRPNDNIVVIGTALSPTQLIMNTNANYFDQTVGDLYVSGDLKVIGRVNIGSIDRGTKLWVDDDTDVIAWFHNTETGIKSGNQIHLTDGDTGTESNDGVLIGLNSASELEIINNENADMTFWTNGVNRLTLTSTGDLYSVAWTDYSASSTVVGWTAPTISIYYKKIGNLVFCNFNITGTSNSSLASFTLPYLSAYATNQSGAPAFDNSATSSGYTQIRMSASTFNVQLGKNNQSNLLDWTSTGTKTVSGIFWYETF